MKVHEELGNKSAAAIHKKLIKDPNSCQSPEPVTKLTLMQAVSLVSNGQTALSKAIYNEVKRLSDECGAKFMPCYTDVWDAKKLCRPSKDAYTITETEARIAIEPLVHHTSDRIFDIPGVSEEISTAKAATPAPDVTVKATVNIKVGNDT